VIQQLEREYPIRFVVIANKRPTFNVKSLEFIEWNQETEIDDLLRFDIGLMPLPDDIWAKGKCGFKALQYMALGIPTVASPVGVNTTIIENEVDGFLCDNDADWLHTLVRLTKDPDLRIRIGKTGIDKINRNYSVEANTENFLKLFINTTKDLARNT
jgi:glycosyltransferase involved in cell wall biosynthesis